jgi:hypothetical protein
MCNILFLCSGDGNNELNVLYQILHNHVNDVNYLIFVDTLYHNKEEVNKITHKFIHITDKILCRPTFEDAIYLTRQLGINLIVSVGFQAANFGQTNKEIIDAKIKTSNALVSLGKLLHNTPWWRFEYDHKTWSVDLNIKKCNIVSGEELKNIGTVGLNLI